MALSPSPPPSPATFCEGAGRRWRQIPVGGGNPWGAHGRAGIYGNQTSCLPTWVPSEEASAERRRPDVDPGAAIFPLATASIQKERVLSCLQP
ncbi:unnamed protein product [Urochloa humidicola]